MIDRQYLIPMIRLLSSDDHVALCRTPLLEVGSVLAKTKACFEAQRYFLDRYRSGFSDRVLLAYEGTYAIPFIEKLQADGFDVIPLVSFDTEPHYIDSEMRYHHSFADVGRLPFGRLGYFEYFQYLLDNRGRFKRFWLGDNWLETRSHDVDRLFATLAPLSDRSIVSLYGTTYRDEIVQFRNRYEVAPIRQFLIAHEIIAADMVGYFLLFNNFEDYRQAGYTRANAGLDYVFAEQEAARYVHSYDDTKAYTSGLDLYSGIGMTIGARRHHLERMISTLGYRGGLFFWPRLEEWLGDIDANCLPYFTDTAPNLIR